jgi:hypothetical protein
MRAGICPIPWGELLMEKPKIVFRRFDRGRKKRIPPLGIGPILFFILLNLLVAFIGFEALRRWEW